MSDTNTGGPAFPMPGMSGLPNDGFIYGQDGMTLRDYAAFKAMSGMLSNSKFPISIPNEELAMEAYKIADAMLKARG